ncbi:MAG: hypothetical protein K2Q22_06415, partial [Cytophagales bacterium]|nr:hypothetical protein [Cytophagales bacterium]
MTRTLYIYISIAFFGLFTHNSFGQHSNVFSLFMPHKKIAIKEFESGNYLSASKHYKVLVGLDSTDAENILKLAYCYDKLNRTVESEYYYKMATRKANLDESDLAMYVDVLY